MNNKKAAGNLSLKRLNVGAGKHLIVPGYIHVDEDYDEEFVSGYAGAAGVGILRQNITQSFHFTNIEQVYACHVLEHLTLDDGLTFLHRCKSSMAAGGTIRICVPDFDMWYNNPDKTFYEYYRSEMPYPISDVYEDDFAFMTTAIYGHGHKMIYNEGFLTRLLERAGFRSVTRRAWGESALHNIDIMESQENLLRKKESLIIEAVK